MRQGSWGEIFAPRYQPAGVAPEVPAEPRGWKRLVWWEDLITFTLLGFILLAVIASIDRAHWVRTMPSLYPIAFFGLFLGTLLARLRWREGYIHLLVLPVGAAASLGQIMSILAGGTPLARWDVLHDRMAAWLHIAFYGGISNDDLPFIILVVPLVWLTSYLSAWAIFRWQNAWLALVPAGAVLLVNISLLPGDFSLAFVAFLLGAVLLTTRLNLLERAKAWRAGQTPYPPLLSLSVLHATFWLALVLLGLAWLMPQAGQTDALASIWNKAASPVDARMVKLSRLFVSVNNKKSYQVHDFSDLLPFLGSIGLPDTPVADVTASSLNQPAFLRAQAYDLYTAHGWLNSSRKQSPLGMLDLPDTEQSLLDRQPVHISVLSQQETDSTLLTVGQPVSTDLSAVAQWSDSSQNVSGLVSPSALQQGDSYSATGSVSTATAAELRAADIIYPDWVRSRFLQLPDGLPARVPALARAWTQGEDSAYDKAVAIETNLRSNYAYDLNIPDTPPGRDTVDYFLFDVNRGYFDYHSSAMVVLLRSLGIPARLAVGYVLDPSAQDAGTGTFRITEANAFAWPEVYFPGYGWVEFNPTPSHPAVDRAGGDTSAANSNQGAGAAALNPQDLNPGPAIPPVVDAGAAASPNAPSKSHARWIIGAIIGGAALVLASGTAGLRYAWVRGLSGLDTPARLWGQTARLASWARAAPGRDETPAEFARKLQTRVPGAAGVDLLAQSYVRHRYGRTPASSDDRLRLEATWRRVRKSLILRLLHLA